VLKELGDSLGKRIMNGLRVCADNRESDCTGATQSQERTVFYGRVTSATIL
jgi:hypothetical protein